MAKKKDDSKLKKKVGRPTDYCEKIVNEICETIPKYPIGLDNLCDLHPHWPNPDTIHEWKIKHPEFSDRYLRAKRLQVDAYVEEIIKIAYDSRFDTLETKYGTVCNTEWVQRSKLKVDTLKWFASRLAPKLYGDKIQNDINIAIKNIDEWVEFYASMDENARLVAIERITKLHDIKEINQ